MPFVFRLSASLAVTALSAGLSAQSPEFEVASVKVHPAGDPREFMVALPGGRFEAENTSLPGESGTGRSSAGRRRSERRVDIHGVAGAAGPQAHGHQSDGRRSGDRQPRAPRAELILMCPDARAAVTNPIPFQRRRSS